MIQALVRVAQPPATIHPFPEVNKLTMPMGRPRFDPRQQQRGFQIRVNHRIRVPEVRVIGADGNQLGVLQTHEAMRMALEQGLDLVEVNPKADPPVCKILDFGKYKYEEKKKTAEAKRKQTVVEIKEIKLRPKTDDHDVDFKIKAARRFLEAGHKVKITVRFRGREITHPEKASEQITLLVQGTEDLANLESRPMMEARTMTVLIAPKPAIMQRVAAAKVAAEKARQQAEREGRPLPPPEPSQGSLPDVVGDDDDDDDDEDDDKGVEAEEPGKAEAWGRARPPGSGPLSGGPPLRHAERGEQPSSELPPERGVEVLVSPMQPKEKLTVGGGLLELLRVRILDTVHFDNHVPDAEPRAVRSRTRDDRGHDRKRVGR